MTTAYPGSAWRPVPYTGLHPRLPMRAALLHTNGGGAQLFGYWSQVAAKGSHIGAQYQVFKDGTSECYVDPALVVYHAFGASEWAIGIETEDDGHNSTPWTAPQMAEMARILHHHQVPPRRLSSATPAHGVGTHQDHPEWNHNGHDCAGAVRSAQIPHVLQLLTALTAAPPPHADVWEFSMSSLPILRAGTTDSAHVKRVQSVLNGVYGEQLLVDGALGPKSVAAVKRLQAHLGHPQSGIVDGPTWANLLLIHA